MILILCVQETDQTTAVGMLLDLIIAKLNNQNDRMPFNQIVYALVQTEQLECAGVLDADLCKHYLQHPGVELG